MKEQSAIAKVKFDTQGAFARMGAAVDILKKASPKIFEHKSVCEQQGRLRSSKRSVA